MEKSVERAIDHIQGLAALAEQLAGRDVVVHSLHCDWSSFGSWAVHASTPHDEERRAAAIRHHAFSEPGSDVFRVSWDGKDRYLSMAWTPTTVVSMLNQWKEIQSCHCDSSESALDRAHQWFLERLGLPQQ